MDARELVPVYTVNHEAEAEIIRNALRDEGIACEINSKNQGGFSGIFEVVILTHAGDAERARSLIASHEHKHKS